MENNRLRRRALEFLSNRRTTTISNIASEIGCEVNVAIDLVEIFEKENLIRFGRSSKECGLGCKDCGVPCSGIENRILSGASIVISKIITVNR